jgi:hypothetical protein
MDQLIFTRYLYPKADVKQSLLLSLLDKNAKDSLFWAYELYYSGYDDVFIYLHNIYESFYKSENPELQEKLFSKGQEDELWIGTVIMTLSMRNFQINHFLETYKGVSCLRKFHLPNKGKFIIGFKSTDLEKYKMEVPYGQYASRLYLQNVCKHQIRRECNVIFESSCDNFNNEFDYHWLYFASRSPVWMYRIRDFGGHINDETMKVEFPNDDLLDAFYDRWGIEPDEQPITLKDKCIGNSQRRQLSIEDFCEKYGGVPKKLGNTLTPTHK